MRIPMMFMRMQPCSETVKANGISTSIRTSYIVALPKYVTYNCLDTKWQDNPKFPDGEVLIPSIDILADEDTYIFDGDDSVENYRQALLKMKELWSQTDVI